MNTKRLVSLALTASMVLGSGAMLSGCGAEKKAPKVLETICTVEAETGTFTGNCRKGENSEYSGGAYATGFEKAGDRCTLEVEIPRDGFYDLHFEIASCDSNYKENYVFIDGVQVDPVAVSGRELADAVMQRVYLTTGKHEIALEEYWGYINWDKLTVIDADDLPEDIYKVSAKLNNPNASDNAKRVMSYMTDIYGKSILSGQYGEGGYGSWEVFQIKNNNGGKQPAVIGLEMGHCCATAQKYDFSHDSVNDAIKVWETGGIVTMCYHWLAPDKYINGTWYKGFNADTVNMPLDKIMNGEDEEGMQLLLDDIAILAGELQKLEDAGVPVLWRPLHEAAGGWFWWGESGSEAYKKLYILMYDKLVNEYGLDNLIWLWNGQNKEWYPGDEYVDIIGIDIYPGEQQYSSHINKFLELYSWLGDTNKMIVLSENGTMPDIEMCAKDGAMWGFFCTWSGEFVITKGSLSVKYSEQYTDKEMLKKIYESESVITLDELPDLKTYKIKQ